MKIIVLGAGLVGGPMAIDLNKEDKFEVTVADFVSDYDLVVNAVPDFMGFNTDGLRTLATTIDSQSPKLALFANFGLS